MTNQNVNADPMWEEANDPEELVFQYWGQFSMRPWKAALIKGAGKVPYDPAVHKTKSSLVMDMQLFPIPEQQLTYSLERDPVTWGNDYKVFLKAAHEAGFDPVQTLNGAWVRMSQKPTGETYVKDGQTKNKTYFHIEEGFTSEEACKENYFEIMGDAAKTEPAAQQPLPTATAAGTPPAQPGVEDPRFAQFRAFLDMAIVYVNGLEPFKTGQLPTWADLVAHAFTQPTYQAMSEIYGTPEAQAYVEQAINDKLIPF